MPSSNTITAFYSFTAGSKAKASEVGSNFNTFRGHIIPVDPTVAALSNNNYDLGATDYVWRRLYLGGGSQYYILEDNGSSQQVPRAHRFSPSDLRNYSLAASVAANALTITLNAASGSAPTANDPIEMLVRNATAATGTSNTYRLTSAITMTISSGSTLGHSSGNNHYIYVYVIDTGSSIELAVSSSVFDEGSVQSSTAEGGAGGADSNATLYSTTARTTKGIRLIGRMKSNQATAGTWASSISEICLVPFIAPKVKCKAYRATSTQTINNNQSPAETIEFNAIGNGGGSSGDNYNCFNTTTGIFTAPKAMTVLVGGAFRFGVDTYPLGTLIRLDVAQNSTVYTLGLIVTPNFTSATQVRCWGSTTLDLAAGDTLSLRAYHNQGGTEAIQTGEDNSYMYVYEI